jgi:hypothetical protein
MQPSRFEIMVLATVPVHRVRKGVWYLESEHEDVAEARIHYGHFLAEHPDPRLIVVLVESRFDESQGIFADRILATRAEGPVPALRGSRALPPEARRPLREAFGRAPLPAPRPRRRSAPPPPPPRRSLLPWLFTAAIGGGACLAVIALGGF